MNRTRFKLEIECDYAAFCADNDSAQENADARGEEIGRILEHAMRKVSTQGAHIGADWPLFDSNGNKVGMAKVTRSRVPQV